MQHVLAIDLGTGGAKVALIAADGTITDRDMAPTRTLLYPGGGAEQDPDDWWRAIGAAVGRMRARRTVPGAAVVGVGVTAHWSGTVAVDSAGRHLMNAIIWMDSRGARYADQVTGGPVRVAGYDVRKLRRFISRAGGLPGHSGKDPTAHIHFIRHQHPEVYRATRVFLEPADYINLRLTGRACSSYDCVALHWVSDNRDLGAVRYDPVLLRHSGLDPGRLPELVPSATVVGKLRDEVAAGWDLPPGTPVITATGDMPSAVVGSGAIADYAGHLYIGTSSWLSCHVPAKRTDLFHNQTTLPAALPGRYFIANEHETAGACLDFAREVVGLRPEGVDGTAGADKVFQAYEEVAARVPPGSSGVIFTPWLNGERTPVDDRTVRAGWHNLSVTTTRGDLIRAIYEGTAYNSRWLLAAVEHFAGRRLGTLAFIGGGAGSALWSQIHADVLDRTVRQMADPRQANVRGAAFLAFVALGLLRPEDIPALVPVAAEYRPRPEHREVYDRMYRAFVDLYRRTRTVHGRLNRT